MLIRLGILAAGLGIRHPQAWWHCGEGQVFVALLRAGRGRHGHDHQPFPHAAQPLEDDGESAGVTTTRAGKC
jgi:hypothetical protein